MPVIDEKLPTIVAPSLTRREMMVIVLMSAGHTAPEIATLLELRPRTVENHKRRIYEKLGVGSQSQAVAKAIGLGLLQLGRMSTLDLPSPDRPQHAGEPGLPILAVLMGPDGSARDEVAQLLISERVPLVITTKREDLSCDHWASCHRGRIVVVLVDPEPADWSAATSVSAHTVVIWSRDIPEQLAITDALARKVSGLVAKADVTTDFGPILATVARGLLVMSWRYAEALLKWAPTVSLTVPELTARERGILASIACGHSIRQTARTLGIATKTVENIQGRLFRKLGARNRMDALTIANSWGLIEWTALAGSYNHPARAFSQPSLESALSKGDARRVF